MTIPYREQVLSSYKDQSLVYATLYHCWTATTHKIRAINSSNNTLSLIGAPHVDIKRCEHASGKRFYLENVFEALTPGHFFVSDTEIFYMPLPQESLPTFTAYAPVLTEPIVIANTTGMLVRLGSLTSFCRCFNWKLDTCACCNRLDWLLRRRL